MRGRPGKLDVRFLVFFSGVLLLVVVASLVLFPEWRESPATMAALLVLAAVGVVGFAANFRAAFMPDRKDAAPAALDYDSPQHRRNQANVAANVRSSYIDGVLREALGERVRLELALDDRPETLRRPMVLVEGKAVRRPLAGSAEVTEVFRRSGQALLILGAPGSGKTITLLELCEPLLERAEADPREPVPVVLNLSTWAQKRPPLAEWIVEEMWRQDRLGKHVTPVWLAADHLILLFDGLDEVRPDARDACVRAINTFREGHGAGMVVCSRSGDYAELAEQLALREAVEILPLDEAQVAAYLGDERLGLGAVREAIERDNALRELAQTPLMLSIMAVAYGSRPLTELLPLLETEAARRANLYDAYIERAFQRWPLTGVEYSAARALRWLRFLAQQMTQREEMQFFVEDLQPGWLPRWLHRWYRVMVSVPVAWLLGILGAVMSSPFLDERFGFVDSVLRGLLIGITIGLIVAFGKIESVDELKVDLTLRKTDGCLKLYFLFILAGLVVLAVIGGAMVLQDLLTSSQVSAVVSAEGMFPGPVKEMPFVLLAMLLTLLNLVLNPSETRPRNRPNQGIRRSTQNAIRGAMLFGLLGGGLGGALFGGLFGLQEGALIVGLSSMLFGALVYGGAAVWQHFVLRLLLHHNFYLPFRLVSFLDAMRVRIFVQRAGAHYRFIHRTFQEHIAALTDERIEKLARD